MNPATAFQNHSGQTQKEPRISVVVPSYNHASYVEWSLRSILNQSLAPSELLVIDDGSIDDSPGIIDRVLHECSFPCELIVRSNRGLCATLNEGLVKTSGQYFAYLGSDDLWLPNFLAARLALLEKRPQAVLAYGHAFLIDAQNRITDCTQDWADYTDGDVRSMLLLENVAPMSPTVVYRRTALQRRGWNERAQLEDYELYLLLSADGEFAFDPRVLSAWRQHGTNTSRDYVWMIEARLAAQRDVADQLSLSANELRRSQRALEFAAAEDFLRLGQKREALRHLRRGLTGAPSAIGIARAFLRLTIPGALMKWRNRRKQTRAQERYGSLTL
jgi:alpha-1,3-rhamnosyltransferase